MNGHLTNAEILSSALSSLPKSPLKTLVSVTVFLISSDSFWVFLRIFLVILSVLACCLFFFFPFESLAYYSWLFLIPGLIIPTLLPYLSLVLETLSLNFLFQVEHDVLWGERKHSIVT